MRLRISALLFILLVIPQLASAQKKVATATVPPPQFTDPQRKQKLAAAFPEIEKLFNTFLERSQAPGAVLGVVVDGELVWVKAAGVREKTNNAPVTNETVFRIASMTKSFTAMSILKLR